MIRTGTRPSAKAVLNVLLVGMLAMVSFGAWALSSPVGSTPDEDFHLASIWCGQGERQGLCELDEFNGPRLIPDLIETTRCFAQLPQESGACQGAALRDGDFGLVESTRVNSGSQYPTGYYFWSSFLAGENLVFSTLLIRLTNALVFTVLGLAVWLLSPAAPRSALAIGTAISIVPLGMFFLPSVNPTSWSIGSALLLLPALSGWFRSQGWRAGGLAVIALLLAALGLWARGDSAVYTIVGCIAVLTLMFTPTRRFLYRSALPAGIAVLAAVSYFGSAQGALALAGMTQTDLPTPPLHQLIVENLLDLPELLLGVFGMNFSASQFTGLGWLDTPLPASVWGATLFALFGVLFTAMHRIDLRRALALAGVVCATVAVPMIILAQGRVPVGWQVQPRYIMPLVLFCVFVALLPSAKEGEAPVLRLSMPQRVVVITMLSAANAIALFTNIQRYTAPGALDLNTNAEWWWDLPLSPVGLLAAGSFAFAGFISALLFAAPGNTPDSNPAAPALGPRLPAAA